MRDRVDALLPGVSGTSRSDHHDLPRILPDCFVNRRGQGPVQYSIYDTTDRRAALKQAAAPDSTRATGLPPGRRSHQPYKNRLTTAEQHDAGGGDFYTRSIDASTASTTILDRNAHGLDDLLLKAVMRDDDEMRQTLQDRFRYLMIDEYQDTNQAQFVIASALVGPQRNICVVGDPDQSIYGWRGPTSATSSISSTSSRPPRWSPWGGTSAARATSWRLRRGSSDATPPTGSGLHTELGDGDRVVVAGAADEHDEARQLVDLFRDQFMAGTPWREMAVLYRINALEQAFRDGQIPYVVARGTAFYERAEIKDAQSYLRLVVNPRDEVALRRSSTHRRGDRRSGPGREARHPQSHGIGRSDPKRGTGATRGPGRGKGGSTKWSKPTATPTAAVCCSTCRTSSRGSFANPGWRSRCGPVVEEDIARLENLDELVTAAAEWTPPRGDPEDDEPTILQQVAAWLESIALVSDADMVDPENGSVTLMSLHAAKGLEFDVVAMAGFEQGLLPHARSLEDDVEREEERRLCYVGMTRARRTLHLSHAHRRTVRGITERTMPSQFLGEIPADALDRQDDDDPWGTGIKPVSTADWQVGATVRHPTFGLGMIRRVVPRPRGTTATIEFLEYGHRTLLVAQSNLELVDPDERPWEGIDIPI